MYLYFSGMFLMLGIILYMVFNDKTQLDKLDDDDLIMFTGMSIMFILLSWLAVIFTLSFFTLQHLRDKED